uniref:Transmembrane protein n=2 Tax=Parascaris univalens TaxID=6257 RepID=A0A914ZXG0_PARUN
MLTIILFIFTIIYLREYANSQICHPHNIERLNIDYGNDNRPSFVIFGITESCTIFLLPAKYISVSNFIDELYWIDKDGKNECYGAAAHIIPVKDMDRPTIAIYFIQRKLLIEVSCEWKFNGHLYYCKPQRTERKSYFPIENDKCGNLLFTKNGKKIVCKIASGTKIFNFRNDSLVSKFLSMELLHIDGDGVYTISHHYENIFYISLNVNNATSPESLNLQEKIWFKMLMKGDPLAVSFASIQRRQGFVIIALTNKVFNAIHIYQIERAEPKWRILNGPICIAEYHQRFYFNIQIQSAVYYLNFATFLSESINKTTSNSMSVEFIKFTLSDMQQNISSVSIAHDCSYH